MQAVANDYRVRGPDDEDPATLGEEWGTGFVNSLLEMGEATAELAEGDGEIGGGASEPIDETVGSAVNEVNDEVCAGARWRGRVSRPIDRLIL